MLFAALFLASSAEAINDTEFVYVVCDNAGKTEYIGGTVSLYSYYPSTNTWSLVRRAETWAGQPVYLTTGGGDLAYLTHKLQVCYGGQCNTVAPYRINPNKKCRYVSVGRCPDKPAIHYVYAVCHYGNRVDIADAKINFYEYYPSTSKWGLFWSGNTNAYYATVRIPSTSIYRSHYMMVEYGPNKPIYRWVNVKSGESKTHYIDVGVCGSWSRHG